MNRKTLALSFRVTLISIWLALGTGVARADDQLEVIRQRGTFRVGSEGTYPPFSFRGPDNQLQGFDIDVAKEIAAKLEVKPEFITTEWSGIIAGLQAAKFDAIVNQVAITAERKQVVDFSLPYVYSTPELIERRDDSRQFSSLEDLKGKKLGVGLGSNFETLAKSVSGIDVKTYPGASEYLSDLATRRIDAALNDRLMIGYLLKNASLPLRAGAVLDVGQREVGIPIRKNNPKLLQAINEAVTALRREGVLTKLSLQWFGIDASKQAGSE
jgi:cystine transport system substrate-binding protein